MQNAKTQAAADGFIYTVDDLPGLSPFGSVLVGQITISHFKDGVWSKPVVQALDDFRIHPGAHALHYGSETFEGIKAHRQTDDSIRVFRPDRNALRMQESARVLRLPVPDTKLFMQMVMAQVSLSHAHVPPPPGSLYIRPLLIGTSFNIGAAAAPSSEAAFFVMTSPVGDYFAAGDSALSILIETKSMRSTPQFGRVKTGANYAAALGVTLDAKAEHNIDQVLFCPKGDVQETGASNFMLINDNEIMTKKLDDSFLHGVTRASILELGRKMGYKITERNFSVEELLEWTQTGEAALSGTAAVLTGVGTVVYQGERHSVSGGVTGPNTIKLRTALTNLQRGIGEDIFGWLHQVS